MEQEKQNSDKYKGEHESFDMLAIYPDQKSFDPVEGYDCLFESGKADSWIQHNVLNGIDVETIGEFIKNASSLVIKNNEIFQVSLFGLSISGTVKDINALIGNQEVWKQLSKSFIHSEQKDSNKIFISSYPFSMATASILSPQEIYHLVHLLFDAGINENYEVLNATMISMGAQVPVKDEDNWWSNKIFMGIHISPQINPGNQNTLEQIGVDQIPWQQWWNNFKSLTSHHCSLMPSIPMQWSDALFHSALAHTNLMLNSLSDKIQSLHLSLVEDEYWICAESEDGWVGPISIPSLAVCSKLLKFLNNIGSGNIPIYTYENVWKMPCFEDSENMNYHLDILETRKVDLLGQGKEENIDSEPDLITEIYAPSLIPPIYSKKKNKQS